MAETAYVPRLRAEYDKSIRAKLTEKFGYDNVMQVPRLDKVVLNMGVGEAVSDRKKAENAAAAGAGAMILFNQGDSEERKGVFSLRVDAGTTIPVVSVGYLALSLISTPKVPHCRWSRQTASRA